VPACHCYVRDTTVLAYCYGTSLRDNTRVRAYKRLATALSAPFLAAAALVCQHLRFAMPVYRSCAGWFACDSPRSFCRHLLRTRQHRGLIPLATYRARCGRYCWRRLPHLHRVTLRRCLHAYLPGYHHAILYTYLHCLSHKTPATVRPLPAAWLPAILLRLPCCVLSQRRGSPVAAATHTSAVPRLVLCNLRRSTVVVLDPRIT